MTKTVDLSKPVVWTTKGNINESELDQFNGNPFRIDWQIATRADDPNVIDNIVFVKEYYLQVELVKREPHVLKPNGVESIAEAHTN